MSKLKIKNFGPIKDGYLEDDGFMDIKKVTVFIGNQGSGKSTVAKVFSTMAWIEKALNRGDLSASLTFHDIQELFEYQNLRDYFDLKTFIHYVGNRYSIHYDMYENQWPIIEKIAGGDFVVPKIMYVPSERNFLSVIKDAYSVRGLPEPLFDFAEELRKSQEFIGSKGIVLPINNVFYKYDSTSEVGIIYNKEYSVNMLAASSGFQSLVPLYLVSNNLAELISKTDSDLNSDTISVDQKLRVNKQVAEIMFKDLNEDQKLLEVTNVRSKFISKAFINIVEEPEQNLFPTSQREILNSLLEFNNKIEGNKLVITTHSPYLVNYLSIVIQGAYLFEKLGKSKRQEELIKRLDAVVNKKSLVSNRDVVIYQLEESEGTISKLPDTEGIPSDRNYLNQSLRDGNKMFDSLLEIEQEI